MPWWKTRMYTEGLVREFTPAEPEVEDVDLEDLGVTWG